MGKIVLGDVRRWVEDLDLDLDLDATRGGTAG
jgi:hypothetical protein